MKLKPLLKKNGCPVCRGEKPCGKKILRYYDSYGAETYNIYIKELKANYCPNCGRKL